MLVLTLREKEWLTITVPPSSGQTEIRLVVVEGRPDKSRLGIQAPTKCPIIRDDAKNKTPNK